jgi:uncharacterized membrane protein YedE/YeeE
MSELVEKVGARRLDFDWRGWFAIGILAAGALYVAIWGSPVFEGYGWLTDAFDGGSQVWIAPILVLSGIAIGYGAKVAGGCTSGNGLSGISSLSVASIAATATFFATAIAISFLTEAVFF